MGRVASTARTHPVSRPGTTAQPSNEQTAQLSPAPSDPEEGQTGGQSLPLNATPREPQCPHLQSEVGAVSTSEDSQSSVNTQQSIPSRLPGPIASAGASRGR